MKYAKPELARSLPSLQLLDKCVYSSTVKPVEEMDEATPNSSNRVETVMGWSRPKDPIPAPKYLDCFFPDSFLKSKERQAWLKEFDRRRKEASAVVTTCSSNDNAPQPKQGSLSLNLSTDGRIPRSGVSEVGDPSLMPVPAGHRSSSSLYSAIVVSSRSLSQISSRYCDHLRTATEAFVNLSSRMLIIINRCAILMEVLCSLWVVSSFWRLLCVGAISRLVSPADWSPILSFYFWSSGDGIAVHCRFCFRAAECS
ncbi:hypothetical protein FOZ62_007667 [Perkinsus olseni]|uniref:Uncharacterized protein n=2 Tax=Perkinsus olseni TaxID=32597 RepID=A0A7J6UGW3_PEROL|nr:hypothetical protein FOZ62_007667 [Perkinsus olseni]